MKKIKTSLLMLGATLIAATSMMAASFILDPVGVICVNALASSDTWCAMPFHAPPSFMGTVSSVSSNVITVNENHNWSANQWANAYYVIIGIKKTTPSDREGLMLTITANGANTLTVNLADGGNAAIDGYVPSGCQIKIIKYWTLGTLFPDNDGSAATPPKGIQGSSGLIFGDRKTQILTPDVTTAGINLAAAASYFYYTGTNSPGPGWRDANATSILANDTILYPDQTFIVRQQTDATATTLPLAGNVIMPKFQTWLATYDDTTDQDLPVSFNVPIDKTLGSVELYTIAAPSPFVPSTGLTAGTRKDQLLVIDNTIVGYNQVASATYFYYSGASGNGPGWRNTNATAVVADSDVVFKAGTGLLLRKKSGTATSIPVFWSDREAYGDQP